VAGIVLHRPHLGCSAERVRHTFGGPFIIRCKAHAHMTVVEDGDVLAEQSKADRVCHAAP
jgi:hypothetical protein